MIKKFEDFNKVERIDEGLGVVLAIAIPLLWILGINTSISMTMNGDNRNKRKLTRKIKPYIKQIAKIFSKYKTEIESNKYPIIKATLTMREGDKNWEDWLKDSDGYNYGFRDACKKLMSEDDYDKFTESVENMRKTIEAFQKQNGKSKNNLWNNMMDAASGGDGEYDDDYDPADDDDEDF